MDRRDFLHSLGAVSLTASSFSIGCAKPPPDGLDSWKAIRAQFPLTSDRAYLNTGGLGPASRPVIEAIQRQSIHQAEQGKHFHHEVDSVRREAATYLGSDPEEICFTRNASEGNSILCAGLDLRPGDEVIFESHAHPGGSFAWLNRQKLEGIRVRIFEPDPTTPEGNLDRLFDLVNERTRVIQVSHLTAPTGILFDVEAIAREARKRGIWFHIDGAQSAGMLPIDLRQIRCDSFATSGHKWMNGPQGTGILFIAKERLGEVNLSHAGAYSDNGYKLPDHFLVAARANAHEYGTRDTADIMGLRAAMQLQNAIGRQRIAQRGKELATLARDRLQSIPGVEILTPIDPRMFGSILTFQVQDRSGTDLSQALLSAHALRCRVVTERGLNAVRTSWHVYNNQAEVERLAQAVRALAT